MLRRPPVETEQHYRNALLRPPEKTFKQKVRDTIWDKQNKTCLTRSPINWLSITVYYILFLLGVVLIFYVSLLIAEKVASSDHSRPQYILGDSPIGSSPSLNFFPQKDASNLIWLATNVSYSDYVEKIKKQFARYSGNGKKFSTDEFGSCGKPPFGYDKKNPCIFFRLNRMINWQPTPYQKGDELPPNMPKAVKKQVEGGNGSLVWLSCEGTTAKDRDHIKSGFFDMKGKKGFPIENFPFNNQEDFTDPIVAVELKEVDKKKKLLYSFTCTAWANGLDPEIAKTDVVYYFE